MTFTGANATGVAVNTLTVLGTLETNLTAAQGRVGTVSAAAWVRSWARSSLSSPSTIKSFVLLTCLRWPAMPPING